MYDTQPKNCSHDHNDIDFDEFDARTEWTDKWGVCRRCGSTIRYRVDNMTGKRELEEVILICK